MRLFVIVDLVLCAIAAAFLLRRIYRDGQVAIQHAAQKPLYIHSTTPPARIHLTRCEQPVWNDAPGVASRVQALLELGFEDAGVFSIDELAGMCIHGFVKPDEAIRANVGETKELGPYLELVTDYEDGRRCTALDWDWVALAMLPKALVLRRPGVDPINLYEMMISERPVGAMILPSVARYPFDFAEGFAKLRDWRNLNGGLNADELRALAKIQGEYLTDEELERRLEHQKRVSAEGLTHALYHRFFETAELTDGERYRLRQTRLHIIHDHLSIESVAQSLDRTVPEMEQILAEQSRKGLHDDWLDRDSAVPLSKWTARSAFAAFNECLPARSRLRKVAELSDPIAADVYAPA